MYEEPKKSAIQAKLKDTDKRLSLCWYNDKGGYTAGNYLKPDIPLLTERPLEPGAYTLEVTAKGCEPAIVLFAIAPARIVEREVQLFAK